MSDLAASGGYYVAMAAPTIVAQPGTLTGSIGIFGGKFVTGGAYEKLGAHIEAVTIGRNAGLESPERPFTTSERAEAAASRSAASTRVSSRRSPRRARCRWSESSSSRKGACGPARQARQHGLVDALGGLDRAIALAKERAGIRGRYQVEIVSYPAPRTLAELLIEQLSGAGSDSQIAALFSVVGGLRTAERRALGVLTAPARLFNPGEPLALDADELPSLIRNAETQSRQKS